MLRTLSRSEIAESRTRRVSVLMLIVLSVLLLAACENGWIRAKGERGALTYYQKAADKNYPPALAKLADFYFLGEGTQVDHKKSYYNAYFASCLGVPNFEDLSKYKIGLREDEIRQIEQEIDQRISY